MYASEIICADKRVAGEVNAGRVVVVVPKLEAFIFNSISRLTGVFEVFVA